MIRLRRTILLFALLSCLPLLGTGQDGPLDFPQRAAEFPGGQEAMYEWLGENIEYPKMAREAGIQGKVFVQFVIDVQGWVTDVQVLKGIGGGCDEEALRVVRAMPRWTPAEESGHPVPHRFRLPIFFRLTDGKESRATKKMLREERKEAKKRAQRGRKRNKDTDARIEEAVDTFCACGEDLLSKHEGEERTVALEEKMRSEFETCFMHTLMRLGEPTQNTTEQVVAKILDKCPNVLLELGALEQQKNQ